MTEPDGDPAHSLDAENPWPGLMPFTEATQAFFHGRDAEAAELFRRVRREHLTILFGQSGLGKTSLLSAGLFPRLRAADFLPVYLRLDLANARLSPVAQIKAALAESLVAHAVDGRPPLCEETLWAYFHDTETEFWSRRNRVVTPVLVLDQFEEIFTLGHGLSSVDALVDELAALIENRPPASVLAALEGDPEAARRYDFAKESCKLILALREDFLPDLEGLRRRMPSIMDNRMRLTRMDGRQARDVILVSGGHLVGPRVAEKVIAFVAARRGGSSDETVSDAELVGLEIEPALLSIVCRELNNKRIRVVQAQITADLLEGAQQEIVAEFYKSSLAGIDPAVKLFIEDELLTSEGYRDSRPLADALREPGVTRADIDRLVVRRLLRIEERFGTQWVELTHDLLTEVIRQQRDLRREQTHAAQEAEARAQAERERAERAEAAVIQEKAERELQERLAREATERARAAHRLVRRTRIALAAVVVLLIAGGAIGYVAYQRAAEATRNFALALDAARGNVEIVDQHFKTGEIGTVVAKSLLDAARTTFGGLPGARENVATIRARIKLFAKLSETYRTFGDLAAALDAAQTERRLAERGAEAGPEGQRDLADSHSQIGATLQPQGDLTGARKEREAALAILASIAAKYPSNSDLQHDLSDGHINLGDVMGEQGDLAGSLMKHEAGLAIIEQLAAKDPSKPLWQNDLATAHSKVGDALRERGDLAGAIKELQAALAIRIQLVATDEANAGWQGDLAVSHAKVSSALAARGDLAGALTEAQSALTLVAQLAAKDPANASWQLELSAGHSSLGGVLLQQGDLAGALKEYQAYLAIASSLAGKDPANASWQDNLVASHIVYGHALQTQGDLTGALKEFRAALAIMAALAEKDSGNTARQADLAVVHLKMGSALIAQGDLAGALSEFRSDLALMAKLTEKDSSNASWQHFLAVAHNWIGNVLKLQGDITESLAELQAQLGILVELGAKDPSNAGWQRELAVGHLTVGSALEEQGDLAGAVKELQAGVAIAKELSAKGRVRK